MQGSFSISNSNAIGLFDLIHCDLWGPYRTPSSCETSYFSKIVDDYLSAVWIYLICSKTEIQKMFLNFVILIDRRFNKKVKNVRNDNGT